jgi:YbgC/YbaW family acyl-CoA thioester hydrolase
MKNGIFEFKLTRQVEFADTDMAGMMHFSNFFRFMEATERAFFRSLGFSIYDSGRRQAIGWPRVHAACDFRHPLRFEDLVEIHLQVMEKRQRSLVYSFTFRRLNESPSPEVARGTLVVACVSRPKGQDTLVSIPIPKSISDKIGIAPKPKH